MHGPRDSMDGDEIEQEKLILHHIDSDQYGRPVVHSVPSEGIENASAPLEQGPVPPAQRDDDLAHQGRPEWLRNMSLQVLPPHQRRLVRLVVLVVILGVVAGLFYFALGPSSEPAAPASTLAATDAHIEIASQAAHLGTDVGYPGPFRTGEAPHFADEMVAATPTRGASPIQTAIPHVTQFRPFEHMGPLTPYKSAQFAGADNARYLATPKAANGTCALSQVHILHRHGARYPTQGAPTQLVKALLAARNKLTFSGPLEFLKTYEYRLGEELLVPLGREQLHMSGVQAAMDYGRLAATDAAQGRRLFVRAGSQQRIVDSALAWATGFWGATWAQHTDMDVQIEAPGFNTTLAPNFACRAAKDVFRTEAYVNETLASTAHRLQKYIKGATLTPMLLYGMQQLCSYDTVAFGHSEFCALFTREDWLAYEYGWDQRFYYDYGAGHPTGAAMGLGWLDEFLSRVTRTPWNATWQTSENRTRNANAALFPVDRAVYADFTHDSVLTSVLAALRLPSFSTPPKREDEARAFRSSEVIPFAARLVFEVWDCPNPVPPSVGLHKRRLPLSTYPPVQYVRLKLNDAIVPLRQLHECEDRADGLCTLPAFLRAHADRHEQGWWTHCR
ncbi:hypothetical protein MCAP1_003125 [Malassezia caprae]|uniref:Phosphoglycerate mutase-like protein n=1 Tax=Malassezia caprae TaxID=1381934 RepID=A0AAF0IWP5_9BASI|nr:hypothetical protein MCAP1_003125 [Malassezia caprae]